MLCHLCRVEASPGHESSPAHQAARELAAEAVGRLADQLIKSAEDDSGDWSDPTNGLNTKDSESPAEKSTAQVFYCDTCNVTLPVEELQKHRRQKEHTLELFKAQTLEELVRQYADKKHLKLLHEPSADPVPSVDEAEAAKTYKCYLCAITVPVIFKTIHERGLRHLSCRTLTVSASTRARDTLNLDKKSKDKSKNKSGDNSKDITENKGKEDKDSKQKESKDDSGDRVEEKVRFTGKMMKKLLELYIGGDIEDDSSDDVEESEDQPSTTKANALTTKKYFLDIQPFLSYIGKFYTLIADDTEYVTIKMGTEYLRIPASYFNGIYYTNQNGVNFMRCRLCDGFNNGLCYNVKEGMDKMHVMSLGHIRNLLSYMDSVHLIRQIDETHHFCALCNAYIYLNSTDNHVLRDYRHSAALAEALELGKNYKESKRHVKIMVFKPSTYPHKWNFGIPPKHNGFFGSPNQFGYNPNLGSHSHQSHLFGGQIQNAGGFGLTHSGGQNRGSLFGSQSFGSQPAAQVHSSAPGSVFGGQSFGSPAQVQSVNAPGTVFGGQNSFGQAQIQSANAPAFGGQSFGTPSSNTGFGANSQTLGFGSETVSQNSIFGAQNTAKGFFGSETVSQNSIFGAQNTAKGFGSETVSQNSIFGAQNTVKGFGSKTVSQNSIFGAQNTAKGFGSETVSQNSIFGAQNTAKGFGSETVSQNSVFGAQNTANTGLFGVNTKPVSNPSIFGIKGTSNRSSKQTTESLIVGQVVKSPEFADPAKSADIERNKSTVPMVVNDTDSKNNVGNSGSLVKGADVANKQVERTVVIHSSSSSDSE